MAKQVCVIGLGRFGAKLASTLFQREHEVLAIDQDEQRVQEMLGRVTYAVEANATNETALRDLGVGDMDVAVVALGSQIQSSIITTMMLKSMGLPYVIARATDPQHAEILHRVGADKVIFPEEEAAERAASLDLSPNYVEFMHITEDTGVHKLRPPEKMRGMSPERCRPRFRVDAAPRLRNGHTARERIYSQSCRRGNDRRWRHTGRGWQPRGCREGICPVTAGPSITAAYSYERTNRIPGPGGHLH